MLDKRVLIPIFTTQNTSTIVILRPACQRPACKIIIIIIIIIIYLIFFFGILAGPR